MGRQFWTASSETLLLSWCYSQHVATSCLKTLLQLEPFYLHFHQRKEEGGIGHASPIKDTLTLHLTLCIGSETLNEVTGTETNFMIGLWI